MELLHHHPSRVCRENYFLFLCYNADIISHYVASNSGTINTTKNLKGLGRKLSQLECSTKLAFGWMIQAKPCKTSVRITTVLTGVQSRHFLNTS